MSNGTDRYLETLARRRATVLVEAERLLALDQYDAAEQAIRDADSSIYGAVEIMGMYRRRLEQMVKSGVTEEDRPRVEAVFRRAVYWAETTHPEPHTAMEAEQYADAGVRNRAELVGILGYDPENG